MTNGIFLTQHNQEIAQWAFPRERVGSGHETMVEWVAPLMAIADGVCAWTVTLLEALLLGGHTWQVVCIMVFQVL